jgi:hypothetical protein
MAVWGPTLAVTPEQLAPASDLSVGWILQLPATLYVTVIAVGDRTMLAIQAADGKRLTYKAQLGRA